jgi:hypothetical protein
LVVTRGKTIRPDSKGRRALEPYQEISAREAWLFKNKKALQNVKQGLHDAKAGKVYDLGDFKRYIGK